MIRPKTHSYDVETVGSDHHLSFSIQLGIEASFPVNLEVRRVELRPI